MTAAILFTHKKSYQTKIYMFTSVAEPELVEPKLYFYNLTL